MFHVKHNKESPLQAVGYQTLEETNSIVYNCFIFINERFNT
jgi:hypothetical protein